MNIIGDDVKLADSLLEGILCEAKMFFLKNKIIRVLLQSNDPEIRSVARYFKRHIRMPFFPYEFTKKYSYKDIEVKLDSEIGLYYVLRNNIRLYFGKQFKSAFNVSRYYNGIRIEQDPDSPHRYTTSSFCPDENSVLIDIGGAEGFFPIDYIDIVKKVYIFECDPDWVEALHHTYRQYKDKVVIIQRYVSDRISSNKITLDDFISKNQLENENLFIKIDAEGSEPLIIRGAKKTLSMVSSVKIAICTYHSAKHERLFRKRFKGWDIEASKGFVFNYLDYNLCAPYLRRGVLRISKNN